MKTACIVVTYNRKEELLKNIQALLTQSLVADNIYIIDNAGTDGTEECLKSEGILNRKEIIYIRLQENTGGAGGFYEGLKTAHQKGYDYYILMDDDGRPADEKTIEMLVKAANDLSDKGIGKILLNSVVTYDEARENMSFGLNGIRTYSELVKQSSDGLYLDHINPFNGTLVSRTLVDEIGYPNKDFFIRGDDVDYQERARKAGAYLATVIDSRYYHPTFELISVRWKNRIVYVGIASPWKSYYQVRNYVYIYKRDYGFMAALKEYLFQLYCAKYSYPEYKQCLPFMRKGFHDGIKGYLGKNIEPGQTEVNKE